MDGKTIGLVGLLFPARHETPIHVPGHPVPVVEQMRHIEELGGSQQFWCFQFVTTQLLDRPLDGITVFGVFVLDDTHGHTIDHEHQVCTVALARRGLDLPFPGHVKSVGFNIIEVDELHPPVR